VATEGAARVAVSEAVICMENETSRENPDKGSALTRNEVGGGSLWFDRPLFKGEDFMGNDVPEFNLRVTDDRMAVLLDCGIPAGNLDSLLTSIQEELVSLQIAEPPGRDQLEQLIRRAEEAGSFLVNKVLAEGQKPVPPQDEAIEWAQDYFSPGFAIDEKTGAVDYRQHAAQPTAEEGQLVARVILPKDGQDGRDVFGKPVPADKPKRVLIQGGPNVRVDERRDGVYFYATVRGRVRWASNMLAIDEVYHIPTSVGLETGNIRHPGSIVIEGDVLAGSRIEAGGDVEVKGTVEAADIEAGGDLKVHNGITGMGNRSIKVKGSVHAKFILEADIEAGESIVIEREVVQSILKTRGSLTMPNGRLVGGSATALGGIFLREAGSEGLVHTVLVAAQDYCLEEKLALLKTQISQIARNLKRINQKVGPLMARGKGLPLKQREAIEKLAAAAHEMDREMTRLQTELDEIEEDSRQRTKPRIQIRKRLFPETTLQIKEWSLDVKEAQNGPLRAGLMGGRVVLLHDESA